MTKGREVFAKMNQAYDAGYQAFQDGKKLTDNPYSEKEALYRRNWISGWNNAKLDEQDEGEEP